MKTVTIAGVGLIGGSLALALRKAGFTGRILGISSKKTVEVALAARIIDDAPGEAEAMRLADVVYLAQPISGILACLERIDEMVRPGTLITDAGSTKAAIVRKARECIRRGVFVGGHPMAGKETRGAESADADLFQGRTYFFTPERFSVMEQPAMREFEEWVRRMGAVPAVLKAEDHDRLVAYTSHLPQLVSTALAATVGEQLEAEKARLGAGPGLRDMTRLGQSSYAIWEDILATNREAIVEALEDLLKRLEVMKGGVEGGRTREHFKIAENFTKLLRKQAG
ncbi:MAG: prephenate dehydrogenase [Acidimicrobiia bacterium]|nr:prephenate dehydrogenase [Acidimicrobiia bacterium]